MQLRQGGAGELGAHEGQGHGARVPARGLVGARPPWAQPGRVTGTLRGSVPESRGLSRPSVGMGSECSSEVGSKTHSHSRRHDLAGKASGQIQVLPSFLPGGGGGEPCLGLL